MKDRTFIDDNRASREELAEIISSLDESSFHRAVASGWTVSTCLCHLAFWDQRVLFLLKEWEKVRQPEASKLTAPSVASINQAVNMIAGTVSGPAAAELALTSALSVDSHIETIGDEFLDQLASAGFERYFMRFLHRREHIQKIRDALARRQ